MVKNRKARIVAAVITLLIAFAITSCAKPGSQSVSQKNVEKIRVGFSISSTGVYAPAATGQLRAYLLWQELVNQKGGIFVKEFGTKLPVELVYYDDQSSPDTAVKNYERLLNEDKVNLLLGPYGSAALFAVAPLVERSNTVMVASTGSSMKIRELGMKHIKIANPMYPDRVMRVLVDLLKAHKNELKTVGIISLQELFPRENLGFLRKYLAEEGFQIVVDKDYPPGISDATTLLAEVKAKKPDALIGLTYAADSFVIVNQAREMGLNPKFFYLLIGPATDAFREKFKEATEGICTLGQWSVNGPFPGAKDFYQKYVDRWGAKPDTLNSVMAYMAGQIIEQAIEKAGTLNWER